MSKIHYKTGNKCICCEELSGNGTVLHKTRRQTHSLCKKCSEGYLGPQVKRIKLNLKKNIVGIFIPVVKCPGSYHGELRNQCKHEIPLKDLVFTYNSEMTMDILRIMHVLTQEEVMFCPNRECLNIVTIYLGDPIPHTQCQECMTSWCRYCMAEPYHEGLTCLEYEAQLSDTEHGRLLAALLGEGSLRLCPVCRAPTTKQVGIDGMYLGCNKITCGSCGVRWCWLCGAANIDYNHFNNESSNPCAQRLWEGTLE